MNNNQRSIVAGSAILCASVLLTAGHFVLAEPSANAVPRSFMLWMPPGATAADCPNPSDPDSLYLIAHAGGDEQFMITIWDHDSQPAALRGTQWWMNKSKVTHVAQNGTASYPALWKDAVAPKGAQANFGEGAISLTNYRIVRVSTSEDSLAGPNTWKIVDSDSNAALVCLGTGLFSK